MKKIIFGIAVVMCAVSANASYLSWQVDTTKDGYTSAGVSVYNTLTSEYLTTLDITAVPTQHMTTDLGGYGDGYSFAVEYVNYNNSGVTTRTTDSNKLTYSELLNLGVLYDSDSWATGAQKALMWNGVQAVPEPTSGLMVLLGMALLGLKRKKA